MLRASYIMNKFENLIIEYPEVDKKRMQDLYYKMDKETLILMINTLENHIKILKIKNRLKK